MLLFGRKISARKACEWGLITEVYPDATFENDIESRLKEIAALPKQVKIITSCHKSYPETQFIGDPPVDKKTRVTGIAEHRLAENHL